MFFVRTESNANKRREEMSTMAMTVLATVMVMMVIGALDLLGCYILIKKSTRLQSFLKEKVKKILDVKDGRDGCDGMDGTDGEDGKDGRDGLGGRGGRARGKMGESGRAGLADGGWT